MPLAPIKYKVAYCSGCETDVIVRRTPLQLSSWNEATWQTDFESEETSCPICFESCETDIDNTIRLRAALPRAKAVLKEQIVKSVAKSLSLLPEEVELLESELDINALTKGIDDLAFLDLNSFTSDLQWEDLLSFRRK